MKYRFFRSGNKVICVGSYAGRRVRGVAKCDVDQGDIFDFEVGKQLSELRCENKIADKRIARALQLRHEAALEVKAAHAKYDKMNQYYTKALDEAIDVKERLQKYSESLY